MSDPFRKSGLGSVILNLQSVRMNIVLHFVGLNLSSLVKLYAFKLFTLCCNRVKSSGKWTVDTGGCHPHIKTSLNSFEISPSQMSLTYKRNNRGPKTEPWGTLDSIGNGCELRDFIYHHN